MSTAIDEDDDLLAAEHALRLLDGDQERQARLMAATDPGFAAAMDRWQAMFVPWYEQIEEVEPPSQSWAGIAEKIRHAPASGGNVVTPTSDFWRPVGIAMTAIAASLALYVGYRAAQPEAAPVIVRPAAAPVLIATLSSEAENISLTMAYRGQRGFVTVNPGQLEAIEARDYQLWVIPEDGTPISIGLIRGDGPARLKLPRPASQALRPRATIAVSVEPLGGSATGQPTGPVVATGTLTEA